MSYQFTNTWFEHARPIWESLISLLPERRRFLEIGSYEGQSTVWIIENMMQDYAVIDCVDTWSGGEEHDAIDMTAVERRFEDNIRAAKVHYPNRIVQRWRNTSTQALAEMLAQQRIAHYDFIYIDGSHIAPDVLTDACMAWPLLKPNGLMVFDDYLWGPPRDILHRPKLAVDAFSSIFSEQAETVFSGLQYVMRKRQVADNG